MYKELLSIWGLGCPSSGPCSACSVCCHSVFNLNVRRTHKLTLPFIVRQFWNWLPEAFTVLQIYEWQGLRGKECLRYCSIYWILWVRWNVHCWFGLFGGKQEKKGCWLFGFSAFLVFFVLFEKIQLLLLRYRNPAEPSWNGNVLRKSVERRRLSYEVDTCFLIAYFYFLLSEKYQEPLKEIMSVLWHKSLCKV